MLTLQLELRFDPEIEDALKALLRHKKWTHEARRLRIVADINNKEILMDTLKAGGAFPNAGYEADDSFGNLTAIQSPVWSVSDDTILTVTPTGDGSTAEVRSTGKAGTCQVRLDGDADLGDGVRPIFALADVEVLPGDATVLSIKLGTPE